MSSNATTSVVIPCHNGGKYLAEAIASARDQSGGPVEIIVVDDGSTDDSAAVAQGFDEVVLVRQVQQGVASALNHGARVARGELLAFLSADDIWRPEKLALQQAALAGLGNRLVFGHMQHFLSPELDAEEAAALVVPPDPMPAFSAGTLLTRIETFRAIGPLDETFAVGEFVDWYGRARDQGTEVVMLDEVVSMRRVHPSNHSTKALKSRSYAPVLKALLDRRRASGK